MNTLSHRIAWGDAATWVYSTITLGLVIFAWLQLRGERRTTARAIEQTERLLEMQAARDERDLDTRDRTQAALIACRTSHIPNNSGTDFYLRNHSRTPIFDVYCFINTTGNMSAGEPLANLPPDMTIANPQRLLRGVNQAAPNGQFCGIAFRDNAGIHWIKWGDGVLLRGTVRDITRLSPTDTILTRPEDDPRARFNR